MNCICEDESVLIADIIRSQGFTATTTQDVGRKGKSDEEQLEYAVSREWAIVTHNRQDFEELAPEYFASGKTHYGIVIAVRRSPQEIAQRLIEILNQLTADEMTNQIYYI